MSKTLEISVILAATDKASKSFDKVRQASSALSGVLGKQVKDYERLKQAEAALSRQSRLRAALSETAAALAKVRDRQKALLAEMRNSGGASKAQQAEMAKLGSKAKQLQQTQAKYRSQMAETNAVLKQAGVSTRHLADSQSRLKSELAKAEAALKKQAAALDKWEQSKARAADAALKAGALAVGAGAVARTTKSVLSAPIAAYAQTETASTDLRAAMMTSGGQVAAEYQQIDQLATRLGDRLPGTTAEFKNLMTMLMRQGMSAQAVLGGTGEAAALLAVQLKKTPEAAAEMAAKLQDATRGTEKDMLAIMDQVQRLYYAGVDDSNTLGAFAKLSPALDVLKIKGEAAMKSMSPLVGMLDQAGLAGESAGNALRKVFTRMMDTKKIAKATKGSGISLDFTNGAGEFGGMDKMYAELAKLKAVNTESRLKILQGIFGDDAETLQALNTMIEKGKAGYEEFAKKMEAQASLNQRVNDQLGTLSNLWDAASGTFTNFLAKMGESVAPELKALTQWIGSVNEKLSNWAAQNPEMANGLMKVVAVIGIAAAAVAGIATVAAAVLVPLAAFKFAMSGLFGVMGAGVGQLGLMQGAFALARTAFSGMVSAVAGAAQLMPTLLGRIGSFLMTTGMHFLRFGTIGVRAIMMVGRAFLMNPIGLAVTAIIGLLVLLVVKWDWVKAKVSAAWTYIKGVLQKNPLAGFILGPVGAIASLVANFDRLKAAAKSAWDWVKRAVSGNSAAGSLPGKGFSVGGYTGAGGVHEAAGIVHKGEVVFSQRDVAKFGGWQAVEAIRRGGAGALAHLGRRLGQNVSDGQSRPLPVPTAFGQPVAAAPSIGGDHITIHVHAAAGMNEQQLVNTILTKLEAHSQAKRRRAHSAFSDKD